MNEVLKQSFTAGVERLMARSDLLDSINVFPVADGDTGRNLSLSLMPLRNTDLPQATMIHRLLLSARGNSGNIASQFFSAFCAVENIADLAGRAREGKIKAWQALVNPRRGTMLNVFDALADVLSEQFTPDKENIENIIRSMENAVHQTYEQLPKLQEAGVVDAGALGIYIFFEGFFYTLTGLSEDGRPLTEIFHDRLHISSSFQENIESGYCVDFVVKAPRYSPDEIKMITSVQEEVIVIPEGEFYKVHLHTQDKEQVRSQITGLGSLVTWEDDDLSCQTADFRHLNAEKTLHIITDAAGSLTTQDAKIHGFTLLNSYLTIGDQCLPETFFHPEDLYRAMKKDIRVSTSQASVYERHQFYQSALERFDKVLYLCVGSVFTGNYQAAVQWKKDHDKEDRFIILDTGAASGRLGTIALSTARYLAESRDVTNTIIFARKAIRLCEEYLFLDKLHYLAAGGRLSKTSAFFGDKFNVKPVISPLPDGAKKVGTAKNQEDQITFALAKLDATIKDDSRALIMLEYSNNRRFVDGTVRKNIKELYPDAEIILQPLSLTSGAHMGPGTWGVAFLPQINIR
ncbi:MAG TPA: DegV family protein [Smithella sp.]|jgi:DegV family protein with EDD domain|nr:DegV family protein [Smithella sp.]HOE32931.1 DegV family protein [Smithella sp.]HOG09195.1 DegV family protein [Smithella sp.]HOS13289.1 DegV family protein [Smithella sp.]HOX98113.1 DegV family protein [Smithella sp.]